MAKGAKPPANGDGEKASVSAIEEIAMAAFGSNHGPRALRLLNQVCRATRADAEPGANIQAMLAVDGAIVALNPRDEVEQMLVAQMVATHEQVMECLRRATLANLTIEGLNLNLKHASSFSQLYVRQMEALDKHHGKGQQKITVEHVTVESGGQAIVGNVETAPRGERTKPPTPALEHKPDVSVPLDLTSDSRKERIAIPAKAKPMGRTGE